MTASLSVVPTDPAALAETFDQVDVWTVAAGLESMADVLANAYAFRVFDDAGEQVGAYALRGQTLTAGVVVWLVAGQGGVDGEDMTAQFLPHVERQANDADYLAIQTTRPGLVKKLAGQGYAMAGAIMVKKLQ